VVSFFKSFDRKVFDFFDLAFIDDMELRKLRIEEQSIGKQLLEAFQSRKNHFHPRGINILVDKMRIVIIL
jgi:hypothetical protein